MDEHTIPLSEEQVKVAKRTQETGRVRIDKRVDEEEVRIEADLLSQSIDVRRVPVDRWVDGPVPDRQEGDTLVVSVMEEVLVVEKRLKVVEEIHITRRHGRRHLRRSATRRRERAEVTRHPS